MTQPNPSMPVVTPAQWERLLSRMEGDEALARGASTVARKFGPPSLPPGVLPKNAHNALAMDSAAGDTYGYLNQPGVEWCGMGFPGYPYLAQLTQRSEYRSPIETIASEMTREWIKFTGTEESKLKELEEAYEKFGVRDVIRTVIEHDGSFGRGQIYVQIKGQDGDKRRMLPLIVDDEGATIRKGDLLGLKPIEPIWTTPYAYNSIDPSAPDFYKPDAWYIVGKRTHASRLLTFISRPVPDLLKPSYNFGGMSMSQLIEPYVVRWLKTVDSVNRMISNYSKVGLKTNLLSSLAEGGDGGLGLFARLAAYTRMSDNRGIFAIDMEGEEFFQIETSLAGLDKLQAQAQEHMAAPTHIPLVKLTGITPAGLNASADGEIKVFYDYISAQQANVLGAHMMTILRIVQLHLWGKVDKGIGFEWVPMDSPTDAELAAMRKADGDRGKAYIEVGVISADEERERLRTDPNSGYTFLEGAAPEPPALTGAEHAHQLGEEGKDNDAARGEESAEQAAKREGEAREHQAKLDKAAAPKKD